MADRIVQPKVLAGTNPDVYDNLIMQQAQNATNATNVTTNINGKAISDIFESNGTTVKNATNGFFVENFSSWIDFASWMVNNEKCLFFDITFNENLVIQNCPEYLMAPSNSITYSTEGTISLDKVYRFIKSGSIFTNQDMYIAKRQYSNAQSSFNYTISLSYPRNSSLWTLNGNLITLNNTEISFTAIPFGTDFNSSSNITISAYYTNN